MKKRKTIEAMRQDVVEAEIELSRLEHLGLRASPQYRSSLKAFAVAWFVLKHSHPKEALID